MECGAESKQCIQSLESLLSGPSQKKPARPYCHLNPIPINTLVCKAGCPGSPQATPSFICPSTTMATSSHILDIYLSCPRAFALHVHSLSPTHPGSGPLLVCLGGLFTVPPPSIILGAICYNY